MMNKDIYFSFSERDFIRFLIQKQYEAPVCFISFEEAKLYLEYSDIPKLEDLKYRLVTATFPKPKSKKIMVSLFDLFFINEKDKCIQIVFNKEAFPTQTKKKKEK